MMFYKRKLIKLASQKGWTIQEEKTNTGIKQVIVLNQKGTILKWDTSRFYWQSYKNLCRQFTPKKIKIIYEPKQKD